MQEQVRWLSVEEIAAHLGINRDTVYKWIERKRMPAHKVGRLWKFKMEDVDAWVKGGRAANHNDQETALAAAEATERPEY